MRISDWSSDVCSSYLTRPPVDSHDAKPRIDMVPPAREQPEHAAQVRFIGRFFEDAAPDRDGGVAREHDLVRSALDRQRLILGEPCDIIAGQLHRTSDVKGR